MSLIVDGTTGVTFNDSSLQGAAASPYVLKNRIINGDMRIDQRNAGASSTVVDATYSLDRYRTTSTQAFNFTIAQSTTAPANFVNSMVITSSSAYTPISTDEFVISQNIEGLNVADLGWGTANAKTVTLSFWVRSSLTGTFGGCIGNDGYNRCYVFSYTISAANTWEQKTVTIAGDTSGTWLTTNGVGLRVRFTVGAGSSYKGTAFVWSSSFYDTVTLSVDVVATNGATWYITGVQLEIGTSATPFERRLYGQELQLCQRYYEQINGSGNASAFGSGTAFSTTVARIFIPFAVPKRTSPTLTFSSASNFLTQYGGGTSTPSAIASVGTAVQNC